jgi:transposase
MDRFSLTDAQWEKMQPFCLGKLSDRGRTAGDAGCSSRPCYGFAQTGSPWCDLPTSFGNWNTESRPGIHRGRCHERSDFLRKFGAGEGIRTLDPNLGKVVLYP